MSGRDSRDNTTDEYGPGTSTDIGAQNMPSVTAFADMFKAALAPVLSKLTNLNENVSSALLDGHDSPDEDGETAAVDGPAKSADMDADLSAPLTSTDKEAMAGDDLFKELAQN